MKTIPPGTLEEMTRKLVEEFRPLKIILFGSHAWGEPSEESDVDIMVIVEESDEKPIKRDIRARKTLFKIGVPMDVLVKTREEFDYFAKVKATLEWWVNERGMVLYG
jgi:predicted nucleotidyltransferase